MREQSESLGCSGGGDDGGGTDDVDAFSAFSDGVGDIRPPKKTARGSDFRRLVYDATAKYLGASSRFFQKMNVGRCN